jgi:hypothetical protein
MKTETKVLVSRRALIQRLNRVLAEANLLLKKTKGSRMLKQLGDYYLIDLKQNALVEKNVNLETLGRKHAVLAAWERLEN